MRVLAGAKPYAQLEQDFDLYEQSMFDRYDLDSSGTINSSTEVQQLCINLCLKLGLVVTVEDIEGAMTAIGQGDLAAHPLTRPRFSAWFKQEFLKRHASDGLVTNAPKVPSHRNLLQGTIFCPPPEDGNGSVDGHSDEPATLDLYTCIDKIRVQMQDEEELEIVDATPDDVRKFLLQRVQSGLDIYYVAGLLQEAGKWYPIMPTAVGGKYHLWVWYRCLVCCLLQMTVAPSMMFYQLTHAKTFCATSNWEGTSMARMTASGLCFLLPLYWFKFHHELLDNTNLYVALYYRQKKKPMFISSWGFLGIWINLWCVCFTCMGAVLLIYNCDEPMDVVLNALALFFILQLDDEVVTARDLDLCEQYLSLKHSRRFKQLREEELQFEEWKWPSWVCYTSMIPVQFVSAACCISAPLYTLICF